MVAAARIPQVTAIVSRGGRPDLAGSALAEVHAATLLIVGSRDRKVIALNRVALAQLRCEAQIKIVQGATHLFEEPGALEQVACSVELSRARERICNGRPASTVG